MAPKSATTEKQHNQVDAASSDNQEPPRPQETPRQTSSQVTRQQQQQQHQQQEREREQQQPLKRLALIRRQLFCGFMPPSLSIEKQNSANNSEDGDEREKNCEDCDHDGDDDDRDDGSSPVKLQNSSATTQIDKKSRDKSRERELEEEQQQQQHHHLKKTKNRISNKINELSKCYQTLVKPTTTSTSDVVVQNNQRDSSSNERQSARLQLCQQLSEEKPTLECCISLSGFQLRNTNSSSPSTSTSTSNTPSRSNLKNNQKQNHHSNNSASNSSDQVLAESGVRIINHQLVDMIEQTHTSARKNATKQHQQQNKLPETTASSLSLKLTNQREVLELIGDSSKGNSNCGALNKLPVSHQQRIDPIQAANTSERLFSSSHNSSRQHSSEINETTTPATCSHQQIIIPQSIHQEKSSSSTSSTKSNNAKIASSISQATQSTRQLQSDMKAQEHDRMNQLISLLNQFAKQQEQQQQQQQQQPHQQDESTTLRRLSDVEQTTQVDPYYLEENWTCFVHLRSSSSTSSAFSCYPSQAHNVERQNSDLTNLSTSDRKPNNQLANLKIQQDAIWELLTTEVFYIKRLKVIIDLFLNTLLSLQRESLLLDIDSQQITSNVCEVYEANNLLWTTHLLPMLNKSRTSHRPLDPILMRNAFFQIRNIFNPYYKYCLEHTSCLRYVKAQNRTNEYFKVYLSWCEIQKECERLKLTDLLAKPMQRLTRYSLLLKAILKKTDNYEQYSALEQMISQTNKFVLTVDLELRRKDDLERLLNTACRIDSYEFGTDNYNDEIEKLIKFNYLQFDILKPLFDCSFSCQRQLLFDSQLYTQNTHLGQLKFKDAQINGKIEVVVLLFTDNLLVCKQINTGSRWHHKDKDHFNQSSVHQSPTRQAFNVTTTTTTYSNLVAPQKYLNLSHSQQQYNHHHQQQQQLRPRTNSEIQHHHHLNAPILNNGQPQVIQSASAMSARASSLIFTPGGGLESTQISENELNLLGQEFRQTKQRHSSSSSHLLAASLKNHQPAMTVTTTTTATTSTPAPPSQSDRYSSHHSSSSSLIGHAAREFFLRTASNSKSGDNLEQQQKRQQQKQFQLGSYHHNLLNISSNSIFNLTNHCQQQTSGSQQMAASNAAHLRVIRSPYPIERLVMHELKDGQGVFCCQMNDSHTMANSFVLYSSITPPAAAAATLDLSKGPSDNSTNNANSSNNHFKTTLNSRSDSESFNSPSSSYGGSMRRRSSDSRWVRSNQASLSPARQLINIIKQAQIRYQLAANFHNVNLYTFDSPEKDESQQQQQNQEQLKQAEQLVQKISSNNKQNQQHRSRLSTWSSFRHPTKRVNSDSATPSKQTTGSKGLNSQGSLKQDAFELSRLSPRGINSQRQTWLLDKRSASSENQLTNFESNKFESGRRASIGITDQSASKRTDPFMRAIIEQHQLMLLNHGRHEELATCDFRYLVVNSNYLNVIPIAVSLTSPSPLFEKHNHHHHDHHHHQQQQQQQHYEQQEQGYSGGDQTQIGNKIKHQLMQFSQLGSQSSVFEEPVSVANNTHSDIEQNGQTNNQLIISSRDTNTFNQMTSSSLDNTNNSGTFSLSSDQAQLLSPYRYNFTHNRYKKIMNTRRGTTNSAIGNNSSQLSRLSRLTSSNSNQSNSNLEFSSDNEAISDAPKPNSSTDNSLKSNTTSFNSSSTSSTRSSSPYVNDDDNNSNNNNNIRKSSLQALLRERQRQQQQQFGSRRSQYSDSTSPLRYKQNNSNNNQLQPVSISTSNLNSPLILSELSSEYDENNNISSTKNENNTNKQLIGDHIEHIRRAPRRHLNSLRRQNVIQSISSEQTQREQQHQQQQQQHLYDSSDELKGNISHVKTRTKYLTKFSQRESSETTTSGPSVSNLTNSSILDNFNSSSKPVRRPIQAAHNSSQGTTMDQVGITFDNDEDIVLPGAAATFTGSSHEGVAGEGGAPASSETRATSFELGNLRLRDRHYLINAFDHDGDKFDSKNSHGIQISSSCGVRSASIETSTTTFKAAKSPIYVTLTVPNNEQSHKTNNKHCSREQFKNKRTTVATTTNQTTTTKTETKTKSPSFLKIPSKHRQTIGAFGAGGEWSTDDTGSWSNQSGKLSVSPPIGAASSSCCSNDFIREQQQHFDQNDETDEAYLNIESFNEVISSNNTEQQSSSLSSSATKSGGLVLRKLRRILNLENVENRAQAQQEFDVDNPSERASSKKTHKTQKSQINTRSTSDEKGANRVPVLNVTTASPQNLDSSCVFLPVDDSLENLSSGSLVEQQSHDVSSFASNQNQSVSNQFKKYGSLSSCQSSPGWHKHALNMRRSSSSHDLKISRNSQTVSPNHSDTSIEGNENNNSSRNNNNDKNNNHNNSEYKHFIKRCQILFQFNRRNNRHNMKHFSTNNNKTRRIQELDLSKSQDSISSGKTSEAGILDDGSLRPPETRKFVTNSDQNLSSTAAINYKVRKTIIRSNNDIPKLRAALSEAYASDSLSEYDNNGALIDMNCIGNLVNMRLDSESKPDSENALFDDRILRQSESRNTAYLGFHEKLKLHNKLMNDEKASREKKKLEKLSSTITDSQDNQQQKLTTPVDAVSPKTESRYKRASKLRAHFVSKSRRDHHSNMVSTNSSVGNSSRETSRALNLSRSMTGEIFDSLLRAASLRTVSNHNNTSSSQQG